jgi:hypothetical protein
VWVSNVALSGAAAGANTQVQYNNSGALGASANLTFNGTTLTANTLNLTNALGTLYGGTGLTSFTANGVVYASSSSVLATGSALTFDGSTVGAFGGTTVNYRFNANRGTDDTNQGLRLGYAGLDAYRTGVALASAQTQLNLTQTGSDGTRTPYYIDSSGNSVWSPGASASPSEGMRLTSTGLGIGTSSPGAKLQVTATGKAVIFGSSSAQNSYSAWQYNSTDLGYIGNGAAVMTGAGATDFGVNATGARSLCFGTNDTERMRLDSSGNLGLGVTPSAWSSYTAAQIGAVGCLASANFGGGNQQTIILNNAYHNAGFKYLTSSVAAMYRQLGNEHQWHVAPSGTAGNAITFTQAMTLDASGNLGIGTSSPAVKLALKDTSPQIDFITAAASDISASIQGSVDTGTGGKLVFITKRNGNTPIEQMRLDASGNLGLGVTPSAWGYAGNIQFVNGGAIGSVNKFSHFVANAYYNASWLYASTATSAARYTQNDGAHEWFTAPSGTAGNAITFTQAMTLDASGQLVVGGTSPLTGGVLTLQETASLSSALAMKNRNSTQTWRIAVDAAAVDDKILAFIDNGTSTVRMALTDTGNLGLGVTPSDTIGYGRALDIGSASGAVIYLRDTDAPTTQYGFVAYDGNDNGLKINNQNSSGFVRFSTAGTERARIDSSGNLLVGTTSSLLGTSHSFKATGSTSIYYAAAFRQDGATTEGRLLGWQLPNTNDVASYFVFATNSGGNCFNIFANGNVTNTNNSYGAISDVKLKENIVDASPKLADLMQVKVRNYNLIGHTTKQLGVVAQELETVFPAMVDETPDRDEEGNDLGTTTKSVKYSVFVPMLIKAIQEQQALIQSLTDRITQLENKL